MISFKSATVTDSIILAKIHSQSWKFAYEGIIPTEILDDITIDKRNSFFKKALSEGWEEDTIIYKNNIATGLICLGKCRDIDLDNSFGEIWGIYLLPEFMGLNIGTKLINWGISELKSKGFSNVSLWVLKDNIRAIKFYEKHGFEFDGSTKEIFLGKPLTEYRYIKAIY